MTKEGKLIIFSAPSGAGKTTIVHHLLGIIPELGVFHFGNYTPGPRAMSRMVKIITLLALPNLPTVLPKSNLLSLKKFTLVPFMAHYAPKLSASGLKVKR
jgi:ABC-type multidrug transport system ATPase subunit